MSDEKIAELQMRRSLCQMCIRTIDQLPDETDGKDEAMTEYKQQLATIDQRLTKLTGKPPAVVIGLKTAELFGKGDM